MQRRLSIVVVVALLPLTACGARWNDAQRADMRRRVSTLAQSGPAASDGGSSAGAGNDSVDGGTGTDTGSGSTGSGPASSGTGSNGVSAVSKKLPCAAPSTAPGVTDTEIRIGSISSLTGPSPGIGTSAAGAARAYVAYRNATGGICGRKLVLKEADDGTDNGQYRSIITEMSNSVFGVAGGFALGDVGGVDVIRQTRIPVVNGPGQQASADLPTVFDMNPKYENENAVIGKYKFLHDHGATKASVTYLAVDQSRFEAQLQERLMKAAGIQIVQVQELPLSTLSYDAPARAVANSGADYLFFIGTVDSNQSMARSMQDTGYKGLKWPEYFVYTYGTNFIQATGSASEGAITWLRSLPIEEANSNKELAAFVQWMNRASPSFDKDAFAEDSWAGAKAFLDNLEALKGPITREAFVAQMNSVDTFDAGGMFGPIRLGKELTNGCFVGMQVKNGKWQRLVPDSGFICQ
ncbi:MAG TPA: ABC transporter substrate-binding protein [Acidimicrobiales bacterium]|nr:ABC transporter substrate-binding protein [Acidimicrobiales bacterium]